VCAAAKGAPLPGTEGLRTVAAGSVEEAVALALAPVLNREEG
jgi:hypothetical protein